VTEDEFDRVFAVNVKSIFYSARHIIPNLINQSTGGSIINIASIGALRPRPGLVWYNASKAAVTNATKGLAAEYGPHQIRVNSILPLLTATGLFETFVGVPPTEENFKKFLGNVPMGRLGKVEDVANYALWLASDESKFVTGTALEVDGGRGV
jgi:NAD(P)-dependent dehydrogenase (short-subunit alcohol dehydrogenase family)